MPCRSYPEDFPEEMNKLTQAKLDIVSRIACKALQHIEDSGDGLEMLILKDREIAEWWSAHKEADRKEQERKRKEAETKRLKKEALAKLTTEEKKILGLK
jgi:hypothetical protein